MKIALVVENTCQNNESTYNARQIFDIPEIKISVTEHRAVSKTCSNCGKKNQGSFPKDIVQQAQYGKRIKALGVYLQACQILPFARVSEFIEDLTGHHISQGSLANFQRKCYHNLEIY